MVRYYDIQLECGCLTSTTSDILIPCSLLVDNPKCKFAEWLKENKDEKI